MKKIFGFILLVVASSHAQINYYDHVQPIMEEHCITCHAEGKIGPISLDSYESVSSFANMIAYVTSHKIMPPWRANQNHRDLSISKYLSSNEISIVRDWIEGGMLEGKKKPRQGKKENDHIIDLTGDLQSEYDSLGYKTISYKVGQAFAHKGDYTMHQRVFVVPNTLASDVYVSRVEFIPSNRKIVLGCDISIDTSLEGRKYDAMDPRSGYANVIGVAFRPMVLNWYSWSPDDVQVSLEGYKVLPANSDLLLHIQYAPTSKSGYDQSEVRLTYSEGPPQGAEIVSKVLIDTSSLQFPFMIPANTVKHMRAEYKFEEDVILSAIRPYGQLICENWQITFLDNNGQSRKLLEIDDWQFKWQRKYRFIDPLRITKGSKIIARATYNNTVENIDIPIYPTKEVTYGEGMTQELFLVSFDYMKVEETKKRNE